MIYELGTATHGCFPVFYRRHPFFVVKHTTKRSGGPFALAFGMLSFITPKLEKEEKLKEQIVRYDESWLASNINEALYKSVLTPELLTYIVDDIKIKSVENTEDTTTISVSAKLRRTILENDQHIVVKNEKENWTLSRALHPNRLKSKGQDIVIEKECPSCGANYVPDEKGCCSYCGYSLKVDNSKWKIVNGARI